LKFHFPFVFVLSPGIGAGLGLFNGMLIVILVTLCSMIDEHGFCSSGTAVRQKPAASSLMLTGIHINLMNYLIL